MKAPRRGWFVQAVSSVVRQPFFGALDAAGCFCWTDERTRAETFPSREHAERFAARHLSSTEWTVTA